MRLRNITPKSLFGRMLSIILVPIILVQIISVFIFYERHWDSVSRHMSKNLANDIGLLIDELGSNPSKDERSLSATKARQYFNFIFYWLEGGILKPNQNLDKKFFNFRDFFFYLWSFFYVLIDVNYVIFFDTKFFHYFSYYILGKYSLTFD